LLADDLQDLTHRSSFPDQFRDWYAFLLHLGKQCIKLFPRPDHQLAIVFGKRGQGKVPSLDTEGVMDHVEHGEPCAAAACTTGPQ